LAAKPVRDASSSTARENSLFTFRSLSDPKVKRVLSIRRGSLDDLPAVLALLDEAVAWLVAREQTAQWGSVPWSERADASGRIRAMAAEGELWLAEMDGEPVGALIVGEHPPHVHHVERPELYVNLLVSSRRHAGEGIGARLIRTAIERAHAGDAALLRVDCWAGSPKLVGWYESQGFTRSGSFELRGWRGQVFEMNLRRRPRADPWTATTTTRNRANPPTSDWSGPPPGVRPGATAAETLLAHTDDVAVVLGPLFAWPNGVRLTVWLRVRDPATAPDQTDFQLAAEFADGRRAIDAGHPRRRRPPVDGPRLTPQGGAGSWNYWLWPLPPAGPLTFVCAWPSQGLAETKAEIDAGPLREAAARAASW